ncbi:MAG: hypothetical protein ABR564_06580 [Candidatus Dormibacteria bacterium]
MLLRGERLAPTRDVLRVPDVPSVALLRRRVEVPDVEAARRVPVAAERLVLDLDVGGRFAVVRRVVLRLEVVLLGPALFLAVGRRVVFRLEALERVALPRVAVRRRVAVVPVVARRAPRTAVVTLLAALRNSTSNFATDFSRPASRFSRSPTGSALTSP